VQHNTDGSAVGLVVLICMIVCYRRRNKGKVIDKAKRAEDRRAGMEGEKAADDLKGRQTAMAMFIDAISKPFGGR
jgi:hypothetical protein